MRISLRGPLGEREGIFVGGVSKCGQIRSCSRQKLRNLLLCDWASSLSLSLSNFFFLSLKIKKLREREGNGFHEVEGVSADFSAFFFPGFLHQNLLQGHSLPSAFFPCYFLNYFEIRASDSDRKLRSFWQKKKIEFFD